MYYPLYYSQLCVLYCVYISVSMVLLERIELSLPPYQRGILPLNYKSVGARDEIRTHN
jgi:hypothetical protein